MPDRVLTDHTAIRDWAAARSGFPAIVDVSPAGGTQPMLRLVFDQQAYQDYDRPERPTLLLRRLACPHLPPNPPRPEVPADPALPYNPYVTVDYLEHVGLNDADAPLAGRA